MKRLILGLTLLSGCATTTRQAEPPAPQRQAAAPAPEAPPASPLYTFEGVEVFGTRKVPKEKVLELLSFPAPGTRLEEKDLVPYLMEGKKRLTEAYTFASCRISPVSWSTTRTLRVTVDLVDVGDEWRMPFTPEPRGVVPDPGGLLAAWKDYNKTLWKLRGEGAVSMETGDCRAPIACYGRFDHPELAPHEQRFTDGVPQNVEGLVRMMRGDRNPSNRQSAAILLGYMTSREELVRVLLPSVRDPNLGVRNEVLRVLGAAQKGQPRVIVPLETVLEALWYPSGTDRNKAGWALVRIVETEGTVHRKQILDKAGEVLMEMAAAKEKIDHEPARKVLAMLAGQDFGDDEAAWRRWFEQARGARP